MTHPLPSEVPTTARIGLSDSKRYYWARPSAATGPIDPYPVQIALRWALVAAFAVFVGAGEVRGASDLHVALAAVVLAADSLAATWLLMRARRSPDRLMAAWALVLPADIVTISLVASVDRNSPSIVPTIALATVFYGSAMFRARDVLALGVLAAAGNLLAPLARHGLTGVGLESVLQSFITVAVTGFAVARGRAEGELRQILLAAEHREHQQNAALQSSQAQLRLAIGAGRIGVWDLDAPGETIPPPGPDDLAERAAAAFGLAIGADLQWATPAERLELGESLRQTMTGGPRVDTQCRFIASPGGDVRWLRVAGDAVNGERVAPARLVGVVMDITREREQSAALVRGEAGLRTALRVARLGMFDWDITDDRYSWSDGMFEVLGLDPRQVAPSFEAFRDRIHPEDRAAFETAASAALSGEPDAHVECRIVRPDGEVRHVRAVASGQAGPDGKPVRLIGTVLDDTESYDAQEQLRQQKELLSAVIAGAPIVLFAVDRDGIFTLSDGRALGLLGLKPGETVGQSVFVLFGDVPNVPESIRRALAGETVAFSSVIGQVRFDALYAPLRGADGEIKGAVGVAFDTSERERLQQQLVQSQKLEAVGRLAGGVAHDFNNLLTAIIGFNDLAANALEPDHPALRDIEESAVAARKAADLTRQLLAFGRRDTATPSAVDVGELLSDVERLLRRLIGDDITLHYSAAPFPLVCLVEPGQFQQVIVNLAVNARDAMPAGGLLTIAAKRVALGDEYVATHPDALPGDYALIAVTDTGTGIPASALPHIFEPFFTTKELGKGTGLGLATCYGIVRQAGGHITVQTEAGQGTTFNIYIPLAASAPTPRAEESVAPQTENRGSSVILLVEDREEVRTLAARVLRERGYKVIALDSPSRALEAARLDPRVDLIISDVVMPIMDGVALTEMLAPILGPIPAILISGYAEESVVARAVGRPGVSFLGKPFTPDELLSRVSAALSNEATGPGGSAPPPAG